MADANRDKLLAFYHSKFTALTTDFSDEGVRVAAVEIRREAGRLNVALSADPYDTLMGSLQKRGFGSSNPLKTKTLESVRPVETETKNASQPKEQINVAGNGAAKGNDANQFGSAHDRQARVSGGLRSPAGDGEKRDVEFRSDDDGNPSLGIGKNYRTPTGRPDRGVVSGGQQEARGGAGGGQNGRDGNRPGDNPLSTVIRHRLSDDALAISAASFQDRMSANIEAIQLARRLSSEGKSPSSAELELLSRYTGWDDFLSIIGGMTFGEKQVFEKKFSDFLSDLRRLTSDEECNALMDRASAAWFTPPATVDAIAEAVRKAGVESNARFLILGGDHRYLGRLAGEYSDAKVTLQTRDPFLKAIATHLYPRAEILFCEPKRLKKPDDFYDVILDINDLSFETAAKTKSLKLLRPGGLMLSGASTAFLDDKMPNARGNVARYADLITAVRFPARTKAPTDFGYDLIAFRRRAPHLAPARFPDWQTYDEGKHSDWVEGDPILTGMNAFYRTNPNNLFGLQERIDGQHMENRLLLKIDPAQDAHELFSAFVAERMPEGIYVGRVVKQKPGLSPNAPAPAILPDGSLFLEDGELLIMSAGMAEPIQMKEISKRVVTRYVRIRDAYLELARLQDEGVMEGRDQARDDLNRQYDAFVRDFGPINLTEQTKRGTREPNYELFASDPYSSVVSALERYNPVTNLAQKSLIFSEDDRITPFVDDFSDPKSAIETSFSQYGFVDIESIAEATGRTPEETEFWLGDKAFLDPAVGRHMPDFVYLTGDIQAKTLEAEATAAFDPRMERNIVALRGALPPLKTKEQITATLGASWVPKEVTLHFLKENVTSTSAIVVDRVDGHIKFTGRKREKYAQTQWGLPAGNEREPDAPEIPYSEIVQAALNQQYYAAKTGKKDDKREFPYQSHLANAKARQLREIFAGNIANNVAPWWHKYETTIKAVEDAFNQRLRARPEKSVPEYQLRINGLPKYIRALDGSYVPFRLRSNQVDAARRYQQGENLLLHYGMGAGKTISIGAAMKAKRQSTTDFKALGVIPHSDTARSDFLDAHRQLDPTAKILLADKDAFGKKRLQVTLESIAYGDWDYVLVNHGQMTKIPNSPEMIEVSYNIKLMEYEELLEGLKGDERYRVRSRMDDLEKKRDRLMREAEKLQTDLPTFDKMRFSEFYVDEADVFKNIPLQTKHRHLKGLNLKPSKGGADFLTKTDYFNIANGNSGICLSTGTPISNSLMEIYVWTRILRPDLLNAMGTPTFDSWLRANAEITTEFEIGMDGQRMQPVERVRAFTNPEELYRTYNQFALVQGADQIKDVKIPAMPRGYQVVECQMSEAEWKFAKKIETRIDMVKSNGGWIYNENGEVVDGVFPIISDARKLAVDGRLLDPEIESNPEGKVSRLTETLGQVYLVQDKILRDDPTSTARGQCVFLNYGSSGKALTVRDENRDRDLLDTVEDGPSEEYLRYLYETNVSLYEDIRNKTIGLLTDHVADRDRCSADEAQARLRGEFSFWNEYANNGGAFEIDRRIGNLETRILMGPYTSMARGHNFHRFMSAVHLPEISNSAALMRQAIARVLRPGNFNEEIDAFIYGTRGSSDAFWMQKAEHKIRLAESFERGALLSMTGSIEDIGDTSPAAVELKAAIAGDNRVIERSRLESDFNSLKAEKVAYEKRVSENARILAETQARMEKLTLISEGFERQMAEIPQDQVLEDIRFRVPGLHAPILSPGLGIDFEGIGNMLKEHFLEKGAHDVGMIETNIAVAVHGPILIGATVRSYPSKTGRILDYRIYYSGKESKGYSAHTGSGWERLDAKTDPMEIVRQVFSSKEVLAGKINEIGNTISRLQTECDGYRKETEVQAWSKLSELSDLEAEIADLDHDLLHNPVTFRKPDGTVRQRSVIKDNHVELEYLNKDGVVCEYDGSALKGQGNVKSGIRVVRAESRNVEVGISR